MKVFKTEFFKIHSLCAEMNSLVNFGGWLVGLVDQSKTFFCNTAGQLKPVVLSRSSHSIVVRFCVSHWKVRGGSYGEGAGVADPPPPRDEASFFVFAFKICLSRRVPVNNVIP